MVVGVSWESVSEVDFEGSAWGCPGAVELPSGVGSDEREVNQLGLSCPDAVGGPGLVAYAASRPAGRSPAATCATGRPDSIRL